MWRGFELILLYSNTLVLNIKKILNTWVQNCHCQMAKTNTTQRIQPLKLPPAGHYSQVKLKTLLSMSNFTHFLPVDPIKIWLSRLYGV
jgi:hypothetical protein